MTANESFFKEKDAPAVLKHGILKRYPTVFASAAGKNSRVVLLDGYAGPGQYEDGSPGSPLLLLENAASSFRNIECVFVEEDSAKFAKLQRVLEPKQSSVAISRALEGDLSNHLAEILSSSTDAALFAFLDPFGTALSYDELIQGVLGRQRTPPTEVLLHISVNALRRTGGLLRSRGDDKTEWSDSEQKAITRVDSFLGGEWWHDHVHEAPIENGWPTKVAGKLIRKYCEKIRSETGFSWFLFPVHKRPDLKPDYYLVLFAKHNYAFWRFNDALSKAYIEWQEAWRGKANKKISDREQARRAKNEAMGVTSLFEAAELSSSGASSGEYPPFDEAAEGQRWIEEIESNIAKLLERKKGLVLMNNIGEIYGTTLGMAREQHVRAAVKRLHARGLIADDGKGNLLYKRFITRLRE